MLIKTGKPPFEIKPIAEDQLRPLRAFDIAGRGLVIMDLRARFSNGAHVGGVAGHAGLFSSAADLSIYAQMLLNGGQYNGVRVIADSTVRQFTARAAGTRALGWDT